VDEPGNQVLLEELPGLLLKSPNCEHGFEKGELFFSAWFFLLHGMVSSFNFFHCGQGLSLPAP
jgi:hypothetical protein